MLSFALVSAAVASGTALTKPVENPLRRLSESNPMLDACGATAATGLSAHRKERAARARPRILEQVSDRVLCMCPPSMRPHLVLAPRPPL